jgi:hypothetical protein
MDPKRRLWIKEFGPSFRRDPLRDIQRSLVHGWRMKTHEGSAGTIFTFSADDDPVVRVKPPGGQPEVICAKSDLVSFVASLARSESTDQIGAAEEWAELRKWLR